MRVILADGEAPLTKSIVFARLPGPERVVVLMFRDKQGVQRAIKTNEVIEIIDN